MLRGVELLQQEEGATGEEGVRGLRGGNGGDAVAILVVETPQHVQHLRRIGDGLAEVAKSVGELLQLGGVVGDAELALVQTPVFSPQVHGAMELMVAELLHYGSKW